MQRLDKILSEAGVASRKELKSLIRAGRVTVDGAVVREEAKNLTRRHVPLRWTARQSKNTGRSC